MQGFLYWGLDWWGGNTADWQTDGWTANPYRGAHGDGYLMYPGPDGQPLGSARLSIMRDGLEDYEYLTLLERLVDEGAPSGVAQDWQERAQGTLDAIRESDMDLHEARSTDGAAILAWRSQVADLVDEALGHD